MYVCSWIVKITGIEIDFEGVFSKIIINTKQTKKNKKNIKNSPKLVNGFLK